jgi:hypothetical protein
MGAAYTPGLKISLRTRIKKTRRLPLKGEVLVNAGDKVLPDTIVARTELPGILQSIKIAEQMGLDPEDVPGALLVKIGDQIEKGQILARSKGFFGIFKSEFKSPVSGKFELISNQTGHLQIRQAPTPVEKNAYIEGTVTDIIEREGVTVECEGALAQGIFGVGGERQGRISMVCASPQETMDASKIREEHRGCVIIGGASITADALKKAVSVGAIGLVAGGIVDTDLIEFLREQLKDPGYDIGVAITGQEPIPLSIILTEGFGPISMSDRAFHLFQSLEGRHCSINGATQIRAGVIRPEVIVPLETAGLQILDEQPTSALEIGVLVRLIREPWFGKIGTVVDLPSELVKVESETKVRVLKVKLQDGQTVTSPRANVEMIES